MYPILFKIGTITIYSYGFMIAIGVITALLISLFRGKKLGLNLDAIMSVAICGLFGGIIGAKLLYWVVELPQIINNPSYIIETLSSGFVVYGGIIGGILSGYIYCKKRGLDFLIYLDLIVPALAIAQGFGRLGCFATGCCYGRETNSIIGIIFENSLNAPNGIPLIPTQLFSSAGDFILAGILLYYSLKAKRKGEVAALYIILYSIGRFIIEIFRGDPRGSVSFLSTSQFICILMFLIGVYIFYTVHKNTKQT